MSRFVDLAPDLEHVPTVEELAKQGLARPGYTEKGKTPRYQIDPAGYELIRAAMQRNAERQRAHDEQRRMR